MCLSWAAVERNGVLPIGARKDDTEVQRIANVAMVSLIVYMVLFEKILCVCLTQMLDRLNIRCKI